MALERTVLPAGARDDLASFPLFATLMGRDSHRFPLAAEPRTDHSHEKPIPLSRTEELLVLLAVAGKARRRLSDGCDVFFTNDDGVFLFEARDLLLAPGVPIEEVLESHAARVRRIDDERLHIPLEPPWMEGPINPAVNAPGSTLITPVGDLAQHLLRLLWSFVVNGYAIHDDVVGEPIAGLERFGDLVDLDNSRPLSFVERHAANQLAAELSSATSAGALALGPLGLGGWVVDGIDPLGLLGASGDPEYPGLGFRYDSDERWTAPNVTGRAGVFEAHTVPHHPSLRAAVGALAARDEGVAAPWRDWPGVRSSALARDARVLEAVTTIAEHVLEVHGRFPAGVPAVWVGQHLQAHHLNLGFHDERFTFNAYLETHARHFETWHG